MGLIIGGSSASDLILDSQSVSLYVGGNPPTKVWPTGKPVVRITLGTGMEARNQFRAALSARGLDYQTVVEIPFDIELVGSGSVRNMFHDCSSLTHVPDMDTSGVTSMVSMFNNCSSLTTIPPLDTAQVTNMAFMFQDCSSLTHVPDMDTAQVENASYLFNGCAALTDGNVRLIGRHPSVSTSNMITGSGLTREPFYDGVQLTLGTSTEARDQFRAALSARGLDYRTITEIPFLIKLAGDGNSLFDLFADCSSLRHVDSFDLGGVTNAQGLFFRCRNLLSVGDLDTSSVTNANYMFSGCSAMTDGNVRLIGKHPNVTTTGMLNNSGLTRPPFYDTDGNPI